MVQNMMLETGTPDKNIGIVSWFQGVSRHLQCENNCVIPYCNDPQLYNCGIGPKS